MYEDNLGKSIYRFRWDATERSFHRVRVYVANNHEVFDFMSDDLISYGYEVSP